MARCKDQGSAVGSARAATEARRAQREAEIRAAIRAKLGPAADDIVKMALVDSVVGASLEISEGLTLFLRGRASAKVMQRVGLARSELRRALAALGLAVGGDVSESAGQLEGLDSWRRQPVATAPPPEAESEAKR